MRPHVRACIVACLVLLPAGCLSWFDSSDESDTPAAPACGNGKVEDKEQCDNGAANTQAPCVACCRTDCTWQICGDSVVDTAFGEVCDEGKGADWRDGCQSCAWIEKAIVKVAPASIAITGLQSGGWVGAWADKGIQARAFDASDTPAGGDTTITGDNGSSSQSALGSVAPVGDGFVAVWRLRAGGDAVQAALFDAQGAQTSSTATLSQGLNGAAARNDPDVASSSASGDFVAVWQDSLTSGSSIMARRVSAGGEPQGDELTVSTLTENPGQPAVAVAPDGSFAVVWSASPGGVECATTWVRTFHADGTSWGTEAHAGTAGVPCHGRPALASIGAQGFIVAWEGRVHGYDEQGVIQARSFSWDGTAALPPFAVAPTAMPYDEYGTPDVAVDASAGVLIAWQDLADTNGGANIFARRYDTSGQPAGGPHKVNTHAVGAEMVRSAALQAGGFLVAWRATGGELVSGFFYRRVQ